MARHDIRDMPAQTRVLYNDTCPICAREIGIYARAKGGEDIAFCPLNTAAQFGLDADTAARRMHALQGGKLVAGIDAFIAIWAALPRLKWAAGLASLPFVHWVLGAAYDWVLAPIIYRLHLRRQRLKAAK